MLLRSLKNLIVSLMVLLTITPAIAKPECTEVLDSCREAVKKLKEERTLSDLVIKDSKEAISSLKVENADLRASKDAWYHNTTIMLLLGVVAGVVTASILVPGAKN